MMRSPQFAVFLAHRAMSRGQDRGTCPLQRGVEDAEPARQILLDGQLRLELGLELQFLGVVPLLVLPSRDERPERPSLVAVDPVHRVLPTVEAENRGEKLRAKALLLES